MSQWDHLPKPFMPGTVLPTKGHLFFFTFRDATGVTHENQDDVCIRATEAKKRMRDFCIASGNTELEQQMKFMQEAITEFSQDKYHEED